MADPRRGRPNEGQANPTPLLYEIRDELSALRREVAALRSGREREGLIDAHEVARRLGVRPAWVYRHKRALGAVSLGDGAKPRIGFDPARIEEYAGSTSPRSPEAESPAVEGKKPRRRRRRNGQNPGLLPVRGVPVGEGGGAPCR